MAPLILHNVPDDELYVGEDGVQRPYAMVFPHQEGSIGRSRKAMAETGSFGKSTRRSRSRTGSTPAKREDPTIAAADKVFANWFQQQSQGSDQDADVAPKPGPSSSSSSSARRQAQQAQGNTSNNVSSAQQQQQPAATRFAKKLQPTEVILRGYRSAQQQYAAINHYEQLAGRICEDYSREPPLENRRYKSELRDPALTRRQPLTAEERAKVNRADGGEHWIKVTFESADAADAAIYASPQSVLGHLVFAEPYRNAPPARDEAIPDVSGADDDDVLRTPTRPHLRRQPSSRTTAPPGLHRAGSSSSNRFAEQQQHAENTSSASSRTADTTTMSVDSGTVSSGTVTGAGGGGGGGATTSGFDFFSSSSASGTAPPHDDLNSEFCRVIPSARRVRLLPAEQALLPQVSLTQRVLRSIPLLMWITGGSLIGNQVPRTDAGDFDWGRASLYWKFICWLDMTFGLFGGEIMSAVDKDD